MQLTAGSLALTGITSASLPSTGVNVGTVSGALNSGTWSDTTGSGAGWHGTLQLSGNLTYQGGWTQTAGTTTALTTTSSGGYTGSIANAVFTVTVTASVGTTTTVSWTDRETTQTTGSNLVCTATVACTIANGVTITFSASTYPTNASYQAQVGELPPSNATFDTAAGTGPTAQGTTLSGVNLPAFENNGTALSSASAVAFVHATSGTGMGSFALAPGVTVTWDPNNTWGGSSITYSTTAQYAISTGP